MEHQVRRHGKCIARIYSRKKGGSTVDLSPYATLKANGTYAHDGLDRLIARKGTTRIRTP